MAPCVASTAGLANPNPHFKKKRDSGKERDEGKGVRETYDFKSKERREGVWITGDTERKGKKERG